MRLIIYQIARRVNDDNTGIVVDVTFILDGKYLGQGPGGRNSFTATNLPDSSVAGMNPGDVVELMLGKQEETRDPDGPLIPIGTKDIDPPATK